MSCPSRRSLATSRTGRICLAVSPLVLLFVLSSFPFFSPALAAPDKPVKIGVVDAQRIIRESKQAKNFQASFQKDLEAKRAILTAKEKVVRLMDEEVKKGNPKWSVETRREKGEKLAREMKDLQRLRSDLEEELKRKDMELTQKLLGEIREVVASLLKKEGYSLILEKNTVVAGDEALDVTDKVIKLYDARKP